MLKDLETEPTSFKLYGQVNTIAGDFHLGDRWLRNDVYEQLFRYSVQPGDVVLTRKGASIGYARLFPTDGQPGVIDSDTIRIRVNKEALLPHYALLLLHEALYVGEQILNERRGAILPNLNSERVGNLMLAVPDIAQQEKILLFVYGIVNERDRANRGIESQTDRLKEYRQALITAAVTGQLDIEAAA
jgi:type I restriction enzyme S subunit